MIVVDASVVAHVLAVEPAGGPLHTRLATEDELHAPHLMDLEVMSTLRGLVMGGHLTVDDATQCVIDLLDLAVIRYSHEVLAPRVWELRHSLTPYDAIYVALAEALGAQLLTGDGGDGAGPGIRCEVQTADCWCRSAAE